MPDHVEVSRIYFSSLVHRKFSSSDVASKLSKVLTVRYDSSLDIVDIQPASNVLVFYLVRGDSLAPDIKPTNTEF